MNWRGLIACSIVAALAAWNAAMYASSHEALSLAGAVFCGLMFFLNLALWSRR